MSRTVNRSKATPVISNWLKVEHARVHHEVKGVMSEMEFMRQASARPLASGNNTAAIKTEQHLIRARTRLVAAYDDPRTDTLARGISDLLKLTAGQQVKQSLAVAHNQRHFEQLTAFVHLTTPAVILAVPLAPEELPSLEDTLDTLEFKIEGSLAAITEGAQSPESWGQPDNPIQTAALLGEVACLEATFTVIDLMAERLEGHEKVPLRLPGKDDEVTPIIYPFTMVGGTGFEPVTSTTSM